jgi:predicted CxxxxCH...CXXCH cytochrome family protein
MESSRGRANDSSVNFFKLAGRNRIIILLAVFGLFLVPASGYCLDYPHSDANAVGCYSCHVTHGPLPWAVEVPVNQDDTTFNALCWTCHNDETAPFQNTHSSLSTNSQYGSWTFECRVCHQLHNQNQTDTYGIQSFLYSGTSTSVTASGITKTGAGWAVNEWADMLVTGNTDASRPVYYRIISNTADTLTIGGELDTAKISAGNTFAIIYGKSVKDVVNSRPVKFFRTIGTNSFADSDSVIDGICQVCHTRTQYYRNNGTGYPHNEDTVCTDCHTHRDGFKASCNACHGNPPVDASTLVFNPSQGTGSATAGAHDVHAARNISCASCHGSSAGTGTMHNNQQITLGFSFFSGSYTGGRYDGQTGANYQSSGPETLVSNTGTKECSNIYCHGSTMASNGGTDVTPIWDEPSTAVCGTCHGATASNPPVLGSHQKHAGSAGIALECSVCHYNTGALHINNQANFAFDTGAYPLLSGAVYTGDSTMLNGYGSCSNVYCHGSGTPVWGSTLLCNDCHGANNNGDLSVTAGTGHAIHYSTAILATGLTQADDFTDGYAYGCSNCHPADQHAKGPANADSDAAIGGTKITSEQYTAGGVSHTDAKGFRYTSGTCSANACHSDGREGAAKVTAEWSGAKTGDCGVCHNKAGDASPTWSAPHTTHVDTYSSNAAMTCKVCHSVTAAGNTAVNNTAAARSQHPNSVKNVDLDNFSSGSYEPGTGCSATYCHSQGTNIGEGPFTQLAIQAWSGNTGCDSCHTGGTTTGPSYTSGSPKANSHPAHASYSCNVCHYATTSDGTTITNFANHVNKAYDLQPNGVSFAYTYESGGGSCSNISCHGNTGAVWGEELECLDCHGDSVGNRAAIAPQFSAASHHVQGIALTGSHCYQCHWEADSTGRITAFHGGSAAPGSSVDLVIYGAGTRPVSYSPGSTALQYYANGSRNQIRSLNSHCLGCHNDSNNETQPFGDGKTPRQYAWDGSSIDSKYSSMNTASWGKYTGIANAAKKNVTKAYSAHGNATGNAGGWNTTDGVDGVIPNTRAGSENVACFDCHNSHGSTVAGRTTTYGTGTNGILKDTSAGKGGYAVDYKPLSGGSTENKNEYNPGAGLCFDCHLTASPETTPWGYSSTFGAAQPIMGYWDSPYFSDGTFGFQSRYAYKSMTEHKGGHFGESSGEGLSVQAMKSIDGLCTPCHDPHGVSAALHPNMQYGVPLLKGTFLTSPYKEDAAPLHNEAGTAKRAGRSPGYHIDQNTFPYGSISESDQQFAGLCLQCHSKNSLTTAGTPNTSLLWKSKERIHRTVKGWGYPANTRHDYTCSKCHASHNSTLPRLMLTNCLSTEHKGRAGFNASPVLSGSGWGNDWSGCYGMSTVLGFCESTDIGSGAGSGRFPGTWSGTAPGTYNVTCHENATGNTTDQSWNEVTRWVSLIPSPPVLVDKANSSCASSCSINLQWSAVIIADGDPAQYLLEVDDDPSFASVNFSSGWISTTSRTTSPLATNQTYYWRVRVRDSVHTDRISGWSNIDDFTLAAPAAPQAPALIDKTDSACASSCSVQLQWNPVTSPDGDPVQYYLQVDDDPSFSSPNFTGTWSTATTRTTTALPSNQTYYWRVQARDSIHTAYVSPWSSVDEFRLIQPPPAPTLITQPDNECGSACSVQLQWNAVAAPDNDPVEYYVQVDDQSNFSSPNFVSGWLSENNWITPSFGTNTLWYWRVQARDAVHTAGLSAWSASSSFWLLSNEPGPISPADNAVIGWSCVWPSTQYTWSGWNDRRFQVILTNYAGTTRDSGLLPLNQKYWNGPQLDPGYRWYWKVRAYDTGTGQYSDWSNEVSYTYRDDGCVSSCPVIYTWDGTRFAFESDLYGTGKLGRKTQSGFMKPNPNDYYMLQNEPAKKDGYYEIRMVEESLETNYLDEIKLFMMDIPDNRNAFSEMSSLRGGYREPSSMVHTVAKVLGNPVSATNIENYEDISEKISATDGNYFVLGNDRNEFDWNTIELDLGDLNGAPMIKIVIDGVTAFPNSPDGIKRVAGFSTTSPAVQVLDSGGNWVNAPNASTSYPLGYNRPFVIDISNSFLTDTYKVRLRYLFKVYMDAIYLDITPNEPVNLVELPLSTADLRYYGFSAKASETEIYDLIYGSMSPKQPVYAPGSYTRFGDVTPLLTTTDDKFVIFGSGDEISLKFTSPGPVPAGKTRKFLFYTNGYFKDITNFNIPYTVELLPFAEMSNFPYDPEVENYPSDAEHEQYRSEYNTRTE